MKNVTCTSMVRASTLTPAVSVELEGAEILQLSSTEARELAMNMFEAACVADQDALVLRFSYREGGPQDGLRAGSVLVKHLRALREDLGTEIRTGLGPTAEAPGEH